MNGKQSLAKPFLDVIPHAVAFAQLFVFYISPESQTFSVLEMRISWLWLPWLHQRTCYSTWCNVIGLDDSLHMFSLCSASKQAHMKLGVCVNLYTLIKLNTKRYQSDRCVLRIICLIFLSVMDILFAITFSMHTVCDVEKRLNPEYSCENRLCVLVIKSSGSVTSVITTDGMVKLPSSVTLLARLLHGWGIDETDTFIELEFVSLASSSSCM